MISLGNWKHQQFQNRLPIWQMLALSRRMRLQPWNWKKDSVALETRRSLLSLPLVRWAAKSSFTVQTLTLSLFIQEAEKLLGQRSYQTMSFLQNYLNIL